MKRVLLTFTICLAFSGLAIPGNAATLMFSSSLTEGDVTTATTGANAAITELLADFDTFTVTGAPVGNGSYSPLFLAESYTPDSLTVMGSLPALNANLAANTTLLTITFSAAGLTANATATNFSVNFPSDVTGITLSSTLLSDLGLTAANFSLAALTDTGAVQGTGINSYTSSDPMISLTTAAVSTPEPGSVFLMIPGLGLMALGMQKRLSKKE